MGKRLIHSVERNIAQIESHKSGDIDLDLSITEVDLDDTELEDLLVGGKTKVLLQDIDIIRWKQDLEFDVQNSDVEKPIDFYDVGIPGYTGKPKTQSERRLHEADAGKMIPYVGLGVSVNFHKLMNAISGRTKMLKERVRLEDNEVLIYRIKAELSEEFFKTHPLNENLIIEFFYFCSEDKDFESRCKGKSGIEIYQFLEEKYILFKANINLFSDVTIFF